MNLWAVIPSKDRLESLLSLCWQLTSDDVRVVIIDNGYGDELHKRLHELYVDNLEIVPYIERVLMDPPNISKLWNAGLNYVDDLNLTDEEYVVAVLNDDIVVPGGFVKTLATAIELHAAAGAYPDQHGVVKMNGRDGNVIVNTVAHPIDMRARMCGYAFALRGSANLRADERLAWWYGDDDLDWRIRENGGNVLVGGLRVDHLSPNQTTVGVLAEQTGRDRETFIEKWGRAPW